MTPRWQSSRGRNPTSCLLVRLKLLEFPKFPPIYQFPARQMKENACGISHKHDSMTSKSVLCKVNPPSIPGPTWTPDLTRHRQTARPLDWAQLWFIAKLISLKLQRWFWILGSRLFGNLFLALRFHTSGGQACQDKNILTSPKPEALFSGTWQQYHEAMPRHFPSTESIYCSAWSQTLQTQSAHPVALSHSLVAQTRDQRKIGFEPQVPSSNAWCTENREANILDTDKYAWVSICVCIFLHECILTANMKYVSRGLNVYIVNPPAPVGAKGRVFPEALATGGGGHLLCR